jgi:hypothetical protein
MSVWPPVILRATRRAATALAFSVACGTMSAAPDAEVAGWVEPDAKTQAIPLAAFRLERAGATIAYSDLGLRACDRLSLVDEKAVVRVRLASNLRLQLDAQTPDKRIEVPCDQRGVTATLASALRALISDAQQRKARVATLTRDLTPLAVPVLFGPQTNLVAGHRGLFLGWTGGAAPFSVQLLDARNGREVTSISNLNTRSVLLPTTVLEPGQYTLWVRNRAGHRVEGIREDTLMVLPQDAMPAIPDVLRSSGLTEEARTLFYADYLAALEDGRWTLEALQQVAALKGQSAAARQWLQRYGLRD